MTSPAQLELLVCSGNRQDEDELGPDVERLARADERAALGDVLRVVREERVHPLVVDAERDGGAVRLAASLPAALGSTPGGERDGASSVASAAPSSEEAVPPMADHGAIGSPIRTRGRRPCARVRREPPGPARAVADVPDAHARRAAKVAQQSGMMWDLNARRRVRGRGATLRGGARNPSQVYSVAGREPPDQAALIWRDRRSRSPSSTSG